MEKVGPRSPRGLRPGQMRSEMLGLLSLELLLLVALLCSWLKLNVLPWRSLSYSFWPEMEEVRGSSSQRDPAVPVH